MPESLRCEASSCIHNDNLACRLPALQVVDERQADTAGIRCANYHFREHADNYEENNLVEGGQPIALMALSNTDGATTGTAVGLMAVPMAGLFLTPDAMGVPTVDCTAGVCSHNRDGRCMAKQLHISSPEDSQTQDASCLSFDNSKARMQ